MKVQDFVRMTTEQKNELIKQHFDKWVICFDSRQSNFEANVERWQTEHGWKLSPKRMRILNEHMREKVGKLWHYTGD